MTGARGRRTGALARQVAASLDAPASLTPVLGKLFDGVDALGSMPRRTAAMLERAGIGRGARVLDLGCGKGAVTIAVAQRLGCRAVGVDACEPFVRFAREAARLRGVSGRCLFEVGDVTRYAAPRRFDAALMLGLFPIERAAPLLRRLVVRGGVYLIDDAFGDAGGGRRVAGMPTRADVHALIADAGDRLIEEHVPTPSALRRLNASLYRRLAGRARVIARTQRRFAPALGEFLARQRRANRVMQDRVRCAIWLIRRGT